MTAIQGAESARVNQCRIVEGLRFFRPFQFASSRYCMSIRRLLSLATWTHFSMSAVMKKVSSSGELIGTSSPDSSNHFLMAGNSDTSFIAALSFLMIGSGVPGGANNALHATASKPFETVSSKVG